MRILQIIQRPQLRGAEIFACQLAEELNRKGHTTDMIFLFGDDGAKLPFDLSFKQLCGNEKKRWWDFKSYKKLASIINSGHYDIVQANAGDTLKYAALSKMLYGWQAKLVFRNANKISDFLNQNWKRKINGVLVSNVDFVASVSEECSRDFIETFKYPVDKITSLPIGINLKQPAAAEWKIAGEGPFLLSVASFVKEKNHAGLLRIFSDLLKQFPLAKLLLVGEGRLMEDVKRLSVELHIDKSVSFLGGRNDVDFIMAHSHALLLPSLIEGLPAVILEAFANRLPVIAYNVGGISEVVVNKETGWLVEKGNENAFGLAISDLLNTASVRLETIKNNAFRLVTEEYNNEKIACGFLNSYRKLLTANSLRAVN